MSNTNLSQLVKSVRTKMILLSVIILASCVATPEYQDPMENFSAQQGISSGQPTTPYSRVNLGLIYSANSQKAFDYLQENFNLMSSPWANPTSAPEYDPARLRRAISKILGNRFARVQEVKSLNDARSLGLNMAVVFDIRAEVSGHSFGTDSMDMLVSFIALDGTDISELTFHDEQTVPYPSEPVIGDISNRIFTQLQQNLDAPSKLSEYAALISDEGQKVQLSQNNLATDPSYFPRTPAVLSFPRGNTKSADVAVIIGNANYRKQGLDIPDVLPAYADAEGFKQYALQALGIREGNIIDLRDATNARLIEVFGSNQSYRGQLFDWVQPGVSNVHVYYAGHGAPGSDGRAYLVPTDANAQRIELSGYPLDLLYQNLAQLPSPKITVMLEACFSGASHKGSVITNASPIYINTKSIPIPTNITAITAGASNQIASWEEDQKHSLFTKFFLKAMSGEADQSPYGNGDGLVTHEELRSYLNGTMTYFARRYYGRDQNAQIITGGENAGG